MRQKYLNKNAVFTGVFLIALVARLVFVLQWDATPYGAWPILDAQVYHDWAKAVADGHLLRPRAFYASPLFPYVLGLLYWVFGHDLLVVGLFNTLCGAFSILALSVLTFTLFGIEASLIAGLLGALYLPLIFYTAPVMKEPLAILLMVLLLIYSVRLLKQNRWRDYVWAGALLGFGAMARGNVLLLAPVIVGLAFIKWRMAAIKKGALLLGVMCLCIAPATIHNFIASQDFVPINYDSGFNLYIGNSPTANGTNVYPPELSSDPFQEEFSVVYSARQALGREVKPSDVSAYWRDKAIDYFIHNPGQDLFLLGNKFRAFWNNTEAFDNYDINFIQKNFDTVLSWPLVEFWLIFSLAVLGAIAAWRDHKDAVITLVLLALAYMMSVMMFYITDRYRLPIVLFLLPLAGAGLPYAWKLAQAKKWLPFSIGIAGGVFAIGFSFLPFPGAVDLTGFDWGTLTTIYTETGHDDEALDALHRAMAIQGADVGAQAYIDGAFIEHRLGRDDEAERYFHAGMAAYPQNGILLYNYARLKAGNGDVRGALPIMQKAAELSPSFTLIYYGLAMIYDHLGQPGHALEAAWKGLAIDPNDSLLQGITKKLQPH